MSRDKENIVATLFDSFNGTRRICSANLPPAATERVDHAHKQMTRCIKVLGVALKSKTWRRIESAVEQIILKLLDSQNPDSLFAMSPSRRLERELFVEFGGIDLLLQLLEAPLSPPDARDIPSSQIQRQVELWNEVLVLLREVCFSLPGLSDSIFSDAHVVFLFTMLSHNFVFDNTMNLLEEIFAVRKDTFCLSQVPKFFDLVGGLSPRRLAHFCRVLALLLFEPKDRLIMENAKVSVWVRG